MTNRVLDESKSFRSNTSSIESRLLNAGKKYDIKRQEEQQRKLSREMKQVPFIPKLNVRTRKIIDQKQRE